VQWHRYYYLSFQRMRAQVLSQKLAQRSGYRLEMPVLEMEDGLADSPLEQKYGADAINGERIVYTAMA